MVGGSQNWLNSVRAAPPLAKKRFNYCDYLDRIYRGRDCGAFHTKRLSGKVLLSFKR